VRDSFAASESVELAPNGAAGFRRTGGRIASESVAGLARITHYDKLASNYFSLNRAEPGAWPRAQLRRQHDHAAVRCPNKNCAPVDARLTCRCSAGRTGAARGHGRRISSGSLPAWQRDEDSKKRRPPRAGASAGCSRIHVAGSCSTLRKGFRMLCTTGAGRRNLRRRSSIMRCVSSVTTQKSPPISP